MLFVASVLEWNSTNHVLKQCCNNTKNTYLLCYVFLPKSGAEIIFKSIINVKFVVQLSL